MKTLRLRFARSLEQLDKLGLELADRGHVWSDRQRRAYETRLQQLKGNQ